MEVEDCDVKSYSNHCSPVTDTDSTMNTETTCDETDVGKVKFSPVGNSVQVSPDEEHGSPDTRMNDSTSVKVEGNVDGGYGWIIVCASFVNSFIVGVLFVGFSILYVETIEFFETTSGMAGLIGSLYMASGNLFGIVFSVFVSLYGCRVVCLVGGVIWSVGLALSSLAPNVSFLCLSYGIIAGMGFNMVTLTTFVIVQQHFVKLRAVAAAVAGSGISLGTLLSGPIVGHLIYSFGWRGSVLILSGIVLETCVFGSFYRPVQVVKEQSESNHTSEQKNSDDGITNKSSCTKLSGTLSQVLRNLTNFTLFANSRFTLCCIGTLLMNFGLLVFLQHTPSRAIRLGIDRWNAYYLQTAIGVSLLVGRILGGVVGNLPCTDRLLQYGACVVIGGSLLIVLGRLATLIPIAVLSAATGFVSGCFLTIQSTLLSDLVGVANIARAQAFLLVFTGVGAFFSIPLAGFIYDQTNNYNIPFYLCGMIQVVGGGLIIVAVILKHVAK